MALNLRMSNKVKSRHQEGVWNNPVKMQMIVDNKGWKPTVYRPLKTSSLLDSDQLS